MSKLGDLQEKMQEKMVPIATKIGEERHVSALKDGLMATLPLTILGGFALIIAQPPVDPKIVHPTNFFNKFLLAWKAWSVANAKVLLIPYNMTMGLLGLFTVIGVSYFLLKKYKMNEMQGIIIALLTFICVAAPSSAIDPKQPTALFMSTGYLDAKGMFSGMIIAFLTVEITRFLISKNIKIKLPKEVPPMVSAPFEALIPLIINVVLFVGLNQILISAFKLTIPQIALKVFSPLVSASDSLPALILIMLLTNILWFFGIHGGNVVNAVVVPFATMNLAANAAAVQAGKPLPHILSGGLTTLFFNIGGSGAALGMVIAMLIVGKSAHMKAVGKLGIIPDLFGISEPLVFSTPIILNPFLLIPMLVAPVINVIIYYFVTVAGLIGRVYVNVPFTTPGPIQAFLATMDWKAVILWFLLAVLDVIIYIPFVRAYDKSMMLEEKKEA